LKPEIKEFTDDVEVVDEVKRLVADGVSKDDLYVMSHDHDRTDRIADKANANTVGVSEEGFGTAVKNVFRKKGDELRAKLQELGFSEDEAANLEEKLDHGKILLIKAQNLNK